jgi:diguanylate cyclase (GGDEF)-like protein
MAAQLTVKRVPIPADGVVEMAPQNRLQALFDLSRTLSSSLDLADVLDQFTDRAAELTGAVAADLSSWDRDHDVLVQLTEYLSHEDRVSIPEDRLYPLADYPASRLVLDEQSPLQIRVSCEQDDPHERRLLEERGLRSLLMLPLVARGQSIGLMEIVDTADREFDAHDVEFCQALCDVVATAVHNAKLYEQVKEMALRDQVTQLYNRHCFEEQLAAAVARSRRSGESLALLVIDLDGLKRINDLGGHPAGDEALRAAAESLRSSSRLGDVSCRLGGDEFAVILPGATAEAAELVADRAQRKLRELGKGQYSFSGGVALSGDDLATPYELYRTADIAAYRAKTAGGARTLVAQNN